MKCKKVKDDVKYQITFTEEEYKLFYHGIGKTGEVSRKAAGMTEEQAKFFGDLYWKLPNVD